MPRLFIPFSCSNCPNCLLISKFKCSSPNGKVLCFSGFALYSTIYKIGFGEKGNIAAYIIFIMCMIVLVNISAMILLKKIPPNKDTDDKEEKKGTCEDSNSGKENDRNQEREKLVQVEKHLKSLKIVYHGEYSLYQAMTTQDFHWIVWSCVMSQGAAFTYSYNIPVYLKSFELLSLQTPLLMAGPIMGAFSKMTVGLLSDLTLTRCSRVIYLIALLSSQTLGMLLNNFVGDQAAIVTLNTVVQFVTLAGVMAMAPIILSDFYGTTYFPSIWGTFNLFAGLANFVLSFSMGAFYDLETRNDDDTCYGRKCFRVIFIISSLLCVISLTMLLVLFKRQEKKLELQNKEKDNVTAR